MDIISFLIDTLKYTLAGLVVFGVGYLVLRPYIRKQGHIQLLELKKGAQAQLLPLRIQAYERLVIFTERINPVNMLIRLHVSGMSARELQNMVITEIRNEYQHNIAQQLYVGDAAWEMVRKLKDETINMVKNAALGLPEDASGTELSRTILSHLAKQEESPYDTALLIIKRDMSQLY
ncbi:hypothetical protein FW774_03750 (plasmid) [Pedobacter sp. BS3]|uniref:DUF7935 family protein n=1 Tax=Pedobacter sp. BS3 TaxID=2567937 RepID=UPI0011ECEFEC|nr:hypothetical protein [Pedobacter sp. BS3]TZF86174.1 hypothetical protein FW774_03750 [Pedobacter sp. BS3]